MKINSISFGGRMLAAGIVIGAVVPAVIWMICGRFIWPLCTVGAAILLALFVILAIERRQDRAERPFYEKGLADVVPFDPEKQYAVVRSSICTGEKVAGFRDKNGSHFVEVMVIRNQNDIERFKEIYALDSVKTEY